MKTRDLSQRKNRNLLTDSWSWLLIMLFIDWRLFPVCLYWAFRALSCPPHQPLTISPGPRPLSPRVPILPSLCIWVWVWDLDPAGLLDSGFLPVPCWHSKYYAGMATGRHPLCFAVMNSFLAWQPTSSQIHAGVQTSHQGFLLLVVFSKT